MTGECEEGRRKVGFDLGEYGFGLDWKGWGVSAGLQ